MPAQFSILESGLGIGTRGNSLGDGVGLAGADEAEARRGPGRPGDMPYVGLTYLTITDALARYYGLTTANGVLITAVAPGGPAAQAGMQTGDVVLGIDSQIIDPKTSIVDILRQHRAGDRITLTISRRQDQEEITLLLGKGPGN